MRRQVADIPDDELFVYDMAFQRWQHLPWDKVLEEAALIFNLAVFMVTTKGRATVRGESPKVVPPSRVQTVPKPRKR